MPVGTLIHAITHDGVVRILELAGYTIGQRQGQSIVVNSPAGNAMLIALYGCGQGGCPWLRVRGFLAAESAAAAAALIETYEWQVPIAIVMPADDEQGQIVAIGRDIYLASGITPTNLFANINAVDGLVQNAQAELDGQ